MSIQKATEASRLKRLQMRKKKEREAGNQEQSIDYTGTIHAQETGVEPVAIEEANAVEGLITVELPNEVDPDVYATQYFSRIKFGLTNAILRYRDPRVLKVHPSMLPRSARVISDEAKLNMQKKADAKKIAHHQTINRNWKQVMCIKADFPGERIIV